MVKISLASSAYDDVDSIIDYIAKDSVRYAQEFADRIFDRIEQLKTHPHSGRVVPEFDNRELRELILSKYRIVYRIYSKEEIVILRIIHGSKLLEM